MVGFGKSPEQQYFWKEFLNINPFFKKAYLVNAIFKNVFI